MSKNQIDTFNNLPHDGSRTAIQIGNSFQTQDATGTPQTSPLAYSNTVLTIAVPDRAAEFVVYPTTALRVSEIVGMTQYDVVLANSKESFPCAGMSNIYITRDASNGTANFRFTLI